MQCVFCEGSIAYEWNADIGVVVSTITQIVSPVSYATMRGDFCEFVQE
jgi:hypothetical protein